MIPVRGNAGLGRSLNEVVVIDYPRITMAYLKSFTVPCGTCVQDTTSALILLHWVWIVLYHILMSVLNA